MENSSVESEGLDTEALKLRYEEERQKRLRADTTFQYQELKGKFARFAADPYASTELARAPVVEEVDALIMGGGFGGLLVGARLREQGVRSLRIIDRAGDFGGTWYWNRYPGIACDVESYIYLPLIEEMGYVPREKYSSGKEIFEYCKAVAERYQLYEGALFQTEIVGAVWSEARKRWLISTNRGDEIAARFFISCKGLYTTAKLPGIPGIESFQGHSFHTSRWDFAYTGGDSAGGLTNLADKAVGVIGTGSTGLQCIPHLAASARSLHVFQRTPSTVAARNNRPTDMAWWRCLEPGWRRRRMENFTLITSGVPQSEDMVDDGWTDILKDLPTPVAAAGKEVDPADLERAQFRKMEAMRRRIESIVRDPATAEALKPYYHYLCKRPGFSDEYLQTFNRPNVTLVDTDGKGVERITPKGVVAAGREYPLDLLVYATGFDFMIDYTREIGFEIQGRGGQLLSDCWSEGMKTLYGVHARGFPNFMILGLTQAGISYNYIHIAEEQARHMAYVVGRCLSEGIETIEPSQRSVDLWVEAIVANGGRRRAFLDSCTPGYANHEGRRDRAFELNAPFPQGPVAYMSLLEKFRTEGDLGGFDTEASRPAPKGGTSGRAP